MKAVFRILVIDDEAVIRNGIIHLIDWNKMGCTIAGECTNGQEALAYLQLHAVDICVCDVKMPVMDGLAFLAQVRKSYPDIKAVMLTAFSEFSLIQSALREGAIDYVIKNDFMIELPKAIQKAINQLHEDLEHRRSQLENRENLCAYILQGLLFYNTVPIQNGVSDYGLDQKQFCVCKCELTCFDQEKPADLYAIENFLQMTISRCEHYVLSDLNDNIAIVFCAPPKIPFSAEHIVGIVSEVLRIAEEFMRVSIKFGIGLPVQEISSILQSYQQAAQALFSCSTSGNEIQVYMPGASCAQKEALDTMLCKEVVRRFANEDYEGAEKTLLHVTDQLDRNMSISCVKAMAINLCSALFRQADEKYATLELKNLEEQTYMEIENSATRQTLFTVCSRLLRQLREQIAAHPLEKHYLINAIEEYIQTWFCSAISLQDIANAVSVSPSYVSRLYKQRTGKTITQAINSLRINRAKSLLRETTLKAYEVAHQVGIEDSSYFTNLFVKMEGISPSEYRGMGKHQNKTT